MVDVDFKEAHHHTYSDHNNLSSDLGNMHLDDDDDLKESFFQDDNDLDLYAILSLPHKATQEQIRAAYKRMCLAFHPDRQNINRDYHDHHQVSINDARLQAIFDRIQTAYTVLSDEQYQRIIYDKYGWKAITALWQIGPTAKYPLEIMLEALEQERQQRIKNPWILFNVAHTVEVSLDGTCFAEGSLAFTPGSLIRSITLQHQLAARLDPNNRQGRSNNNSNFAVVLQSPIELSMSVAMQKMYGVGGLGAAFAVGTYLTPTCKASMTLNISDPATAKATMPSATVLQAVLSHAISAKSALLTGLIIDGDAGVTSPLLGIQRQLKPGLLIDATWTSKVLSLSLSRTTTDQEESGNSFNDDGSRPNVTVVTMTSNGNLSFKRQHWLNHQNKLVATLDLMTDLQNMDLSIDQELSSSIEEDDFFDLETCKWNEDKGNDWSSITQSLFNRLTGFRLTTKLVHHWKSADANSDNVLKADVGDSAASPVSSISVTTCSEQGISLRLAHKHSERLQVSVPVVISGEIVPGLVIVSYAFASFIYGFIKTAVEGFMLSKIKSQKEEQRFPNHYNSRAKAQYEQKRQLDAEVTKHVIKQGHEARVKIEDDQGGLIITNAKIIIPGTGFSNPDLIDLATLLQFLVHEHKLFIDKSMKWIHSIPGLWLESSYNGSALMIIEYKFAGKGHRANFEEGKENIVLPMRAHVVCN